jgi:cell wall-associated NlpC family hydrolase
VEHHTMRPSGSRLKNVRAFFGAAGVVCAGLVAVLAVTSSAHAAPLQSPADIEAQIDAKWNELEPLIEKHNGVKVELADKKAKVDKLAEQIQPLQLRVDMAMGRVSSISVQAYKNGSASTFNALLTSGSPNTLAAQLSMLDAMAKNEQLQIADVARIKADFDKQKKPLDDLVKQLTTTEAQLAKQEKTISDQIEQYNKMRLAAYGSTGGTGSLKPAPCPAAYDGAIGSKAAQVACSQIGKPYVFGAEGANSFDCSGLMKFAWARATGGRVNLYHYTNAQYNSTKRISRAELRAGDLVFYFGDLHHMAMYVGGGWMVHAPHSGDVVRMAKVDQMPIQGYGRPG